MHVTSGGHYPSPAGSLQHSGGALSEMTMSSMAGYFMSSMQFLVVSFECLTIRILSFGLTTTSTTFGCASSGQEVNGLFGHVSPGLPVKGLLVGVQLSP